MTRYNCAIRMLGKAYFAEPQWQLLAQAVCTRPGPRPAVHRSAAMRQLSEANPTFDVQAEDIIAKARGGAALAPLDVKGSSGGPAGASPQGPSHTRPLILTSRHHVCAATRAWPRAHATLQSEAEGAWYDRLSSDLLWHGPSQPDCAKIVDRKQASWVCNAARLS